MSEGLIVYAAAYDDMEGAEADFEAIKLLSKEKFIGGYESALFEKREDGKVKILNTDASERAWGAKAGLVAGAVIGLIFPPSIAGMAAVGAGVGALGGNIMRGMKRKDIAALGDLLDEGEAGIIFIGEATLEEGMDRLMKRAAKVLKKQVDADAEAVKRAIDEAVG
jgi:uncharacterized membrane protein